MNIPIHSSFNVKSSLYKTDKNLAFIGALEAPIMNRTVSLDTLFDTAVALDVPAYKFLTEYE